MTGVVLYHGVQRSFEIGNMIVFVADGLRLDLHNWYEFDGYHHQVSAESVRHEVIP